jgi:uncharacterized Zn finger protein
MNRDNTPTYNVDRKVANFGDFCKTCEEPKLKKMKRQNTPNSDERQKLPGNFKQKFNPVTRKIDNLSPEEINDRLDKMSKEVDESKVNESTIDHNIYNLVSKSEAYSELKRKFAEAKNVFFGSISNEVPEFDEGDTDHDMAVEALILEATGFYGD